MIDPRTYPAAVPIEKGDVVSIVNSYSVMLISLDGKRIGQWMQLIIRASAVFPSENHPIGFALNGATRPGQAVAICSERPVQMSRLSELRHQTSK